MHVIQHLQRLFAHAVQADLAIERALLSAGLPTDAWREYLHIIGAGEIWLARLDSRPALLEVWPELTAEQAPRERERIATGFAVLLAARTDANLERLVGYTNSAGQSFSTAEEDILLHVAMHAQYHRGKVNALLRANGHEPAPVDFITYVRGAPAAITPR